jgi:hypothetical protein
MDLQTGSWGRFRKWVHHSSPPLQGGAPASHKWRRWPSQPQRGQRTFENRLVDDGPFDGCREYVRRYGRGLKHQYLGFGGEP